MLERTAPLALLIALACGGYDSSPETDTATSAGTATAGTAGTAAGAGGTAAGTDGTGAAGATAVGTYPAGSHAGGEWHGAGTGGRGSDGGCAVAVSGVRVYPHWDALGYSPYALFECTLVYVAPDGALELRDLVSGAERVLEGSELTPRRPSISARAVAWEVVVDGSSQVRVARAVNAANAAALDDAITVVLGDGFHHAGEPRVAAGTVAFTAWSTADRDADTDVLTYDLATGEVAVAIGGPGQQRFPDISAGHIAASDFSEDPSGHFRENGALSDVVLLERSTGTLVRRPRPEKQAFPLLGKDGALAYLEWGAVHPEPKLGEFTLRLGRVDRAPEDDVTIRLIHTDPSYVRPSLREDVIDFVDMTDSSVSLHRVHTAAPSESTSVPLDGLPLGPIAAPGITVMGMRVASGVELRAIAR